MKEIFQGLSQSSRIPSGQKWKSSPLNRYCQLWSQLKVVDCIVCRTYTPDPTGDTVTVPVLPQSLCQQALQSSHDAPSTGHLGVYKTLHWLHCEAYWVSMASDVEIYCRQCTRCQVPAPIRAPLTSVPIGKPW